MLAKFKEMWKSSTFFRWTFTIFVIGALTVLFYPVPKTTGRQNTGPPGPAYAAQRQQRDRTLASHIWRKTVDFFFGP